MAKSFPHTAFISYSHEDKNWATKLETALATRVPDVFRDASRLVPGKAWDDGLMKALEDSQHLVALYSQRAKQSDWVTKEMARFEMIAAADKDRDRRLFIILLDDATPTPYSRVQMITSLKDAGEYAKGPDHLTPAKWDAFVNPLAAELKKNIIGLQIPTALFVMTLKEAEALKPDYPESKQTKELKDLLPDLGIDSIADLANRYGANRQDWTPLGPGTQSLDTLISELEGDLSNIIKTPVQFPQIDLISGEFDQSQQDVAQMATNYSLVIIDPLSLYSPSVFGRLALLGAVVQSRRCLVLVMASYPPPQPQEAFRKVARVMALPHLNHYFQPAYPPRGGSAGLALCAVDVNDPFDMRRMALSLLNANTKSEATSAFTSAS